MKRLLAAVLLISLALPALADDESSFWNDGQPEVVLGAYFDPAGTDTLFEGQPPDTLIVYLTMWNGSRRNEGLIRALEYLVELPPGLALLRDELPDYSNLAMGKVNTGFTQAIRDQIGDGLLINTLTLLRTEELAPDARIRILPHPDSGFLRYVHGTGSPRNVAVHLLVPQDAVINPKLAVQELKPVRSR
jgi:hypothetical protein